jgi:hypothetical protein
MKLGPATHYLANFYVILYFKSLILYTHLLLQGYLQFFCVHRKHEFVFLCLVLECCIAFARRRVQKTICVGCFTVGLQLG